MRLSFPPSRLVRRSRPSFALFCGVICVLPASFVFAEGDPGAARVQLQQGYALKKQGKCDEAIPRFVESVRLDRSPKGLLNLADCEAQMGKLIAAEAHLVEARDLASSRGLGDFESLAVKQLAALEPRMPKIVVQVAHDAPPDTAVLRDDVLLGKLSLGIPLPVDPGTHAIVARGGGYERRYEVAMAERQVRNVEVTPIGGVRTAGAAIKSPEPEAEKQRVTSSARDTGDVAKGKAVTVSERVVTRETETSENSGSFPAQKVVALVAGGLGVAGMGVSLALVLDAKSSWRDAAANCTGTTCGNGLDVDRGNTARKQGDVATIVFAGGAASLALGGILWFTAPQQQERATWRIAPLVGGSSGGVVIDGRF